MKKLFCFELSKAEIRSCPNNILPQKKLFVNYFVIISKKSFFYSYRTKNVENDKSGSLPPPMDGFAVWRNLRLLFGFGSA